MDSVWYYFTPLPNNFVKCKNCDWKQQQDKSKSTKNMIRHLDKAHNELEKQRKKAKDKILEEKEKAIKSLPKITTYATGSRYLVSTHLINTKNILATNRL